VGPEEPTQSLRHASLEVGGAMDELAASPARIVLA